MSYRDEPRPAVLTPNHQPKTDAVIQQKFVDIEGRWLGWADLVRNKAGDVSDRHYHPNSETYVYIIRGSLTVRFGPEGGEKVVARAGDFLLIPSKMIHQETTCDESDLEAFVIRVGREPEKVSVSSTEQT